MSYQALARKWRPRSFSELVGQAHVVRALSNALDQGRVHHAFLFTGTRGVGKTTVARILAKCLNCERGVSSTPCGECAACEEIDLGRHMDLIEVDAASRAKVDETRELMNNVQFAPTRARHKIYLIDEVHMFSDASFNALLKTLEEPPPHVKFLLATTDPQRMPVTVLSRCLQFSLKRLPSEHVASRIEEILSAEEVPVEPLAARMLARAADGSLRDALSLLDQAIAHGGGKVEAEPVRNMLGLLDRRHVRALVDHLASGDGAALLAQVDAMAGEVADFGEALAELLGELKHVAVAQAVPEALNEEEDDSGWLAATAEAIPAEDVQLLYQVGLIGRRDLPLAPDPRTGFEMTLLRMLAFRPDGEGVRTEIDTPAGAAAPTRATGDGGAAPTRDAAPAHEAQPASGAQPTSEWAATVAALELQGLARELASNCELVAVEDSRVRLRLAPEHRQLASGRGPQRLEEALSAHHGRSLELAIDVGERQTDSPAELARRDAERRIAQATRTLERDPGVRAIVDTFDGRLEPESIRPRS
jgi:DNA polymerase-3 subunit gamma/tau